MLVPGHGLQHEGRPVLKTGCCGEDDTHVQRNYYDQHGHGECLCGELSDHEVSTNARKAWHRVHKDNIRLGAT
jgi:hypothetical protein